MKWKNEDNPEEVTPAKQTSHLKNSQGYFTMPKCKGQNVGNQSKLRKEYGWFSKTLKDAHSIY